MLPVTVADAVVFEAVVSLAVAAFGLGLLQLRELLLPADQCHLAVAVLTVSALAETGDAGAAHLETDTVELATLTSLAVARLLTIEHRDICHTRAYLDCPSHSSWVCGASSLASLGADWVNCGKLLTFGGGLWGLHALRRGLRLVRLVLSFVGFSVNFARDVGHYDFDCGSFSPLGDSFLFRARFGLALGASFPTATACLRRLVYGLLLCWHALGLALTLRLDQAEDLALLLALCFALAVYLYGAPLAPRIDADLVQR